MVAGTGQISSAEGRGSVECVAGGVWLKACYASVVAVVLPHYLAGGSRHGWGVGDRLN